MAEQAIILEDLQLREIKFEQILEEMIQYKLIQSQEKKTAYQRNETLSIIKETERESKQTQNAIDLINTEASVQGLIVQEKANAEYFKILFQAIIDSYLDLCQELSINDSKERLQFIYVSELPQMSTEIRSFVGFKQPLVG